MLSDLQSLLDTILSIMTSVFSLYLGGTILTGVLALWFLKKVAKLFDKII